MDWQPQDYKHQELTRGIIRVFYEVYNELGHGFLESIYQRAMFRALTTQGIAVTQQQSLAVWFRGEQIGEFRPDLLVADRVIVELKACRTLEPIHEAQLLNYLRASDIEVGLLLNLGQNRPSSGWSLPMSTNAVLRLLQTHPRNGRHHRQDL